MQETIRLARQAGIPYGAHAFVVVMTDQGVQYAQEAWVVDQSQTASQCHDGAEATCERRRPTRPASSFHVLEIGEAAFAPAPIGLDEIAADLDGAIQALDHQVEQMKGMFPDDDGAIRQAQDDGDEARKRLELYRKAVGGGPVEVAVWLAGGNVQDVTVNRPCTGFTVITLDADAKGETDPDAVEMVQDVVDGDWTPAYVTRHTADDLSGTPGADLVTRPATASDLA